MSTWDGLDDDFSPKDCQAVWDAVCEGAPPPLLMRRHRGPDHPEGTYNQILLAAFFLDMSSKFEIGGLILLDNNSSDIGSAMTIDCC